MPRSQRLPGVIALLALLAWPASAPLTASTGKVVFGKPVIVSKGDTQSAAEPSIRAARDGTLYIVAPQGLGGVRIDENGEGGDLLWRSTNGGKTWQWLGSYDHSAGGGDADIAPDWSGDLWASGLTLVNTTAAVSTDKGDLWTINPIGSLATVVDRQWIETYRDENFAFMTTGQTDVPERKQIISRLERTPGDVPVVVNTIQVPGNDDYQWPGEIAVDEKNGLVYVTFNTAEEKQDKIIVVRTDLELGDAVRSVAAPTKGDSFDSFTAIDVDQAGNVYVVWTERRPSGKDGAQGSTNSYLAISRTKGKTWSKPIKLNKGPKTTAFPWIVAGSKGRIGVAYYGTAETGPSPEDVTTENEAAAPWRVYVAYTRNALAANPRFTEVVATPKPLHKGDVCTSGTGCASGTRDLLDFFQIDLDPCGRFVITYTDNSRDVVIKGGSRTSDQPERVAFVGQKAGPRFYDKPLNAKIC
jgi:hypothetical protein